VLPYTDTENKCCFLKNNFLCLLQLCVRCCDPNNGKAGEEMVRTILPVLLNSGICNTVSEVRAIRYQICAACLIVAVGIWGVVFKQQDQFWYFIKEIILSAFYPIQSNFHWKLHIAPCEPFMLWSNHGNHFVRVL